MPRNPFFHRQGINDPSLFFGRGRILRSLFEMIGSGQSCAVVGERRIGKTSLLACLATPAIQTQYDLDPESIVVLSLDFLALHAYTPEDLWREMLELLEIALDEEPRSSQEAGASEPREGVSFADLRRALRGLKRRGKRVLLLCDEFELAVQNPHFDEAFFGALRSLAGSEGVVYVTASRQSLLELEQYRAEEVRQKVLGSPFFNIFAEFGLGPFETWEVAEMIAISLDRSSIRFDREDLVFFDRVAGRHPYFVQLAAYHLFAELISSRENHEEARARARVLVQRESAKIFRNQWQHGKAAERFGLAALYLKQRGTEPSVLARAAAMVDYSSWLRLEQRGLILSDGMPGDLSSHEMSSHELLRSYRLFSEILFEWIGEHATNEIEALVHGKTPRTDPGDRRLAPAADETDLADPQRYSMLEEIGHGGAGKVYKAWDVRLERIVAIKVLGHDLRADPARLEMLLREARVCAGLRHPHIVVVHDVDMENARLVEEFLPGGSLRDVMEAVHYLHPEDVLALAEQLADALAAAHQAGVVHRDIKPENILLTVRPAAQHQRREPLHLTVKLVDFGTALRLTHEDERRGIVGTLAYMAPEQLAGEEVGPRADLYALGVVLHEARFGRRPTDEAPTEEVPLRDAYGGRLDALIGCCLESDPENRFAGAEELLRVARDIRNETE